jgi:hypothetical protein
LSQPQRIPIRHTAAQPQDGVLNIDRDVLLAEQAYGDQPPLLFPAMAVARQGQIGDNAEELDSRLIDVIVGARAAMKKLRTAFPELTTRHSR